MALQEGGDVGRPSWRVGAVVEAAGTGVDRVVADAVLSGGLEGLADGDGLEVGWSVADSTSVGEVCEPGADGTQVGLGSSPVGDGGVVGSAVGDVVGVAVAAGAVVGVCDPAGVGGEEVGDADDVGDPGEPGDVGDDEEVADTDDVGEPAAVDVGEPDDGGDAVDVSEPDDGGEPVGATVGAIADEVGAVAVPVGVDEVSAGDVGDTEAPGDVPALDGLALAEAVTTGGSSGAAGTEGVVVGTDDGWTSRGGSPAGAVPAE